MDRKLIEYVVIPFVVVGTFPLVSELNESTKPFFSENYIKWIVLWGMFYSKTGDLKYSSIISLVIMAAFPKVFFGEKTYYK
jgi:hypothetical protein